MVKKVAAIIALVVIASLSIAGCTNTTTNTATNPTAQAHDATLEKFVNVTQAQEYSNKSKEIVAWLVTWNNDSSVTILETVKNRTDNSSASSNTTLISFPSTQEATNYMNGVDKSDYSLISMSFKTADAPTLKNVTGQAPSVYAGYLKTDGSILDLTFKATLLMQYDNIVGSISAKPLSFGSGNSASSSHASSILTPIPIPSVSPTPSPSPSPTPTPKPSPTPGKLATSIQFAGNPIVSKGQTIGINVYSSSSGLRICAPGTVTATIGTVTSGGSDCYYTAYINTGSLNPGTYGVTLKFAGDSNYQPSLSTEKITITA